ncbi:hypothetical protein PanWU01x14_135970, partial [Parasponia andersonii]
TLDGFDPVQFLPRQLGAKSLDGLSPEDHERQRTAPDPYKVFNTILARCAHWTNHPDRIIVCQSLASDRLDS